MLQGEHSAILSTFIKVPFSIKNFVLSIFKWPLKTSFSINAAGIINIFTTKNNNRKRAKLVKKLRLIVPMFQGYTGVYDCACILFVFSSVEI